jgi:CheY-like chemotaxis protein
MHARTRARRTAPDDDVATRRTSSQRSSSQEEEPIHPPDRTASVASVVVVDDEASFRSALRRLVEASSKLALVGEADSGEAAVALVRELEPDLIVMDVWMPRLGGIGATRTIKEIRPTTVVCLVSASHPHELPQEAATCGADAIAWKGDLCPELLEELWATPGTRDGRPHLG